MLEVVLTTRLPDGSSRRLIVFAIVDSGAARTYFPLAVADRLGLRGSLEKTSERPAGVGSTFDTWSTPIPVTGQIIAAYPEPQGRTLIGPRFALQPWFGEPADLLLGRADFFQAFRITFHENSAAPMLHLDW